MNARTQRDSGAFRYVVAGVAVLLIVAVAFPLFRLIERGVRELGGDGLSQLMTQPWFGTVLRDSLVISLAGSTVAVLIATLLAWLNERTDATLGLVGNVLPLIPLFLPAVAMAIGWVMLAAPRSGFINGFLSVIPGSPEVNIYSYAGLIFIYVLTLVPYAYIPISTAFRAIDLSREEAARVNGASNVRVFFSVALRGVLPAVAGGFALTTIVAFALYSVPVVIATRAEIDIIAVRLVRSITQSYPTDYRTAIGLSAILFVVLILLWIMQQRVIRRGHYDKVGERSEGGSRTRLGAWKWAGRALLISYILASAVLPLGAMVIVSLQTYWTPDIFGATYTWDNYAAILAGRSTRQALTNSLVLGLAVGLITVLAGLAVIYLQRLHPGKLSRLVDGIAKVPGIISNTILGVAFILAFAGPPLRFGGTLWILVIAYLIVFLPYAVISMESQHAQISASLTEAAAVNGASSWQTVRTVITPLMLPGMLSAWALLFVLMTGDLALAVLLGTPRTPVIGLMLLDYWEQGSFNRVAALSVAMTVISSIVVAALMQLSRPTFKRK